MTDLQKKLREAVAFDEQESWRQCGYDSVKEPHVKYIVGGASAENARLAPILAALEGCVDALEEVRDKSVAGANFNRTAFTAIADDALETLRKALDSQGTAQTKGKP